MKKLIAALLLVALCAMFVPLAVFAEESSESGSATESSTESSAEEESSAGGSQTTHTLQFGDAEHGTITVESGFEKYTYERGVYTYTFLSGHIAHLTFKPAQGYVLMRVFYNGRIMDNTGTKLELAMTEDVSLSAEFDPLPAFQLSVRFEVEGEGSADGVIVVIGGADAKDGVSITSGSKPAISVTVPDGYLLQDVSLQFNGETENTAVTLDKDGVGVLPAITAAATLTIKIVKTGDVAITIVKPEHGTVTASTLYPSAGETVIFTFTPDEGYVLESATLNGTKINPDSSGKYPAKANQDIRVEAVFAEKEQDKSIDLSVNPTTPFGTVAFVGHEQENTLKVAHGSSVAIVIKPDTGYEIDRVTINGDAVSTVVDNTLNVVATQNLAIVVTFKIRTFKITAVVSQQGGGTITAEGYTITNNIVYVEYGKNITFTFTPDMGHSLAGVKVNGVAVEIAEASTFTFTAVSEAQTIAATFKNDSSDVYYTVTASADINGTITPSGEKTVLEGSDLVFTVTPNTGYVVDALEVDGIDVSLTNGTYTLSDIAGNHEIKAFFKKDTSTAEAITVEMVDWTANPIVIDLDQAQLVRKEVFEKLRTDAAGIPVLFQASAFSITVPSGSQITASTDTEVGMLKNSSPNETQITTLLNAQFNGSTFCTVVPTASVTPLGSAVRVFLGVGFADKTVSYYTFAENELKLIAGAVTVDSDGFVTATAAETGDMIFVVTAEATDNYTVTFDVGDNGVLTSPTETTVTVAAGGSLSFTFTPDDGYILSKIIVNNTEITLTDEIRSTGSYSLTDINRDTTVTLRFLSESGSDSEEGNPTGLIIAIVIIALAMVGGGVLFFFKWKQTKF